MRIADLAVPTRLAPGRVCSKIGEMRSKLAENARRELVEANQKLTPEQRLEAFLVHSRLIAELREAARRQPPPDPADDP